MSSDELQQKLDYAKALKEQDAATPVDPRELAERKKYHALYNRIYPLLKKSTFDFAEIADVTGLKERRIREALLSRLALDDMVKLFGHNPGSCYVCGSRIRGFYTQEPFCMSCLRSVETAINSLYPQEHTVKAVDSMKAAKKLAASNILDDLIACGAPLLAITGDPIHTRPEVLNILDRADDDVDEFGEIEALLQLEKPVVPIVSLKVDLRHFGFQRVKPRE